MSFSRKKIRNVSIQEFNEHLVFCKEFRNVVFDEVDLFRLKHGSIGMNAIIDDKLMNISVTYIRGKEACTYICRKDGLVNFGDTTGLNAYITLCKYYKVPKLEVNFSASPFMWYNEKFVNTRQYAYEYDINSAYATIMYYYKFPDTSVKFKTGYVGKNEIGFDADGNIVKENYFALFIFPEIESPFKKFAEVYYNKKQKAKNEEIKQRAKNMLNYSVGFLQRVNPFLRAYIVNMCNEKIKELINEDYVLHCNTDSIVSTKKLDLPLGDKIGEWKLKEGMFAYTGHPYQWDNDLPRYQGVPKGWFSPGWDILKDELPTFGNVVELNLEKLLLEEIKYEI
jgi:hypothetical protein